VVQMKEKRVINASICQYSKGQDFARREGWSSAISDRRAERSVSRRRGGGKGEEVGRR